MLNVAEVPEKTGPGVWMRCYRDGDSKLTLCCSHHKWITVKEWASRNDSNDRCPLRNPWNVKGAHWRCCFHLKLHWSRRIHTLSERFVNRPDCYASCVSVPAQLDLLRKDWFWTVATIDSSCPGIKSHENVRKKNSEFVKKVFRLKSFSVFTGTFMAKKSKRVVAELWTWTDLTRMWPRCSCQGRYLLKHISVVENRLQMRLPHTMTPSLDVFSPSALVCSGIF